MLERDRRSTEDPPAMPFPPRSRPDYLQCDGVRHHGVCFSILPLQFTWAYFSHRPCSSVKADLVLHLCVCVCACVCAGMVCKEYKIMTVYARNIL